MDRVPFPKFHNWTLERYKRQLRDAGYFDPFTQPPPKRKRFNAWDKLLCGAALVLLLVAMGAVYIWKEVL